MKSLDTEDWFDRHIKRPFSFLIAWILAPTGITPNAVTIISMIIGAGSTWFFMHASYHYAGAYGLMMNVIACFMLMFADVLDCVDGQLARLTGRRSKWGRILDGSAGYVWFVPLYLGLVYRFYFHHEIEFRFLGLNDDAVTVWIVTIIVLVLANFAGFMGLGAQSRVVDYLIRGICCLRRVENWIRLTDSRRSLRARTGRASGYVRSSRRPIFRTLASRRRIHRSSSR